MARIFLAPEHTPDDGQTSVFLAGSIDMGKAVNWQTQVTKALAHLQVDIYNPRRDDWHSTWKQEIGNDQFREQVEWELEHQEKASIICFYFDPNGQAPITLLEMGLFSGNLCVVCCPDGYFRKGNVDIVCNRYNIPQVNNLEDMIDWLKVMIENDKLIRH